MISWLILGKKQVHWVIVKKNRANTTHFSLISVLYGSLEELSSGALQAQPTSCPVCFSTKNEITAAHMHVLSVYIIGYLKNDFRSITDTTKHHYCVIFFSTKKRVILFAHHHVQINNISMDAYYSEMSWRAPPTLFPHKPAATMSCWETWLSSHQSCIQENFCPFSLLSQTTILLLLMFIKSA